MDEIAPLTVRPRLLEWPSLLLWPPVSVYGAYVVLGILFGMPKAEDHAAWLASWHRALIVGGALGGFLMVKSAWKLWSRDYWWQDASGLTRGRAARLRISWDEIESVVQGMPPRLPFVLRVLGRVPTQEVQGSMQSIDAHRRNTLVLRLRGRRLLPISLLGRGFVGGEAFRAQLQRVLADRVAPFASYTAEEVNALARVSYGSLITLP